ncbi:MAG: histidinol-phosphate transaminase [Candidatus Bathyarchaeota archaeon]
MFTEFSKHELKEIRPVIHGGDIFEMARKYNLDYKEILDFSANVNPLGPSPKVIKTINANADQIPVYPDSNSIELREAIANFVGKIGPENVVVGNGSTELIYQFCNVFLDNGSEAIVILPTFGEYENAVLRSGGSIKKVVMDGAFTYSPKQVLRSISDITRMIFLCNPNNPTGNLLSEHKLQEIIEGALEKDVLVFLDEDCLEFSDSGGASSYIRKVHFYPNLFVIRSFTKVFGLSGLRVGFGVGCKKIVDNLLRVKIPWNVNRLAQIAAITALDDFGHVKNSLRIIRSERSFLSKGLSEINGFKVFLTQANFILINIKETGFTSSELKDEMLKRKILIRDCSSFKGLDQHFIRVSVRTHSENKKLLSAFAKTCGKRYSSK